MRGTVTRGTGGRLMRIFECMRDCGQPKKFRVIAGQQATASSPTFGRLGLVCDHADEPWMVGDRRAHSRRPARCNAALYEHKINCSYPAAYTVARKCELHQFNGSFSISSCSFSKVFNGPDNGEENCTATNEISEKEDLLPRNPITGIRSRFTNRHPSYVSNDLERDYYHENLLLFVMEVCTIPLDTAKVRLQLQKTAVSRDSVVLPKYRGMLGTVATIAREEGLAALWKGVVPGLHRQCLFGGLRIGLYEPVKNLYVGENFVGDVPLSKKILAGLTTGALAISIATPTDLVKVRLQAEGKLPPGVPRRYSGALNAYSTIVKLVKSRMMGDPSYKSTVDCFVKTLKNDASLDA
ncbi:Mitochondrial uncoupling protein 1 [Platanthera guangdongensis]|uniref:Mitochondrial uncoupling protein 1 n=1 Tax=Platanthera guangdongensis TaxID=2320717 RepID=A0ABR2LF47_9ASPA